MATEFVGIELQLMGAAEVRSDLQQLDKLLNSFRGKKKFDAGFNEAKNQVVAYRGELEKLKRLQDRLAKRVEKYGNEGLSGAAYEKNAQAIEQTKQKLREAQQAVREFGRASQQAGATFKQTFNKISSTAAHIGSAMQSLGNAMTRLTSPFSRLTTGLLYGAGYKVLNLFTEGLSGTFERADTMKLYPKMLQEFGFSAEKSDKAIKQLEESVLGLPTGLDEIVAVQKRFVAASQDMDKATGLAIAYNNAVLASGSDARQQWTAQRIITQLAGGADIAATSWDALQRAIPLVFTELSKEAKMGVGDYVSALKTGQISTEDFMKSFTKIGGEGGAIAAAAKTMTKSWGGLTANIQNATKRMGTAILDTLHEVFTEKTGRDLLDTLLGIDAEGNRTYDGVRDWIDGLSESIQNWIRSNPDKIIDFFDTLKSIDIKGFAKGLGEGMKDLATILGVFADWASNHDMERLGRWMPRLNIFGKGLTVLGGILKGTRHIWGGLGAGMQWLAKGRLGKIGLFGRLASLFGKTRDIEMAGEAGKAIAKASPSLIKGFKNMALLSGIIAMPAVTAWGVTASAKKSVENFKAMIDLTKDIDWDDAKKALAGIGGFLGGSALLGFGVGKLAETPVGEGVAATTIVGETIVGVITGIASAFMNFSTSQISKGLKNFASAVKALDEIPDIGDASALFSKVENAVKVMNEITGLLNGDAMTVVNTKNPSAGGGLQGMDWGKSFEIKNLSKALKALAEMGNSLKSIANLEIPEGVADKALELTKLAADVARAIGGRDGFGGGIPLARNLGTWSNQDVMTRVAEELIQLRRMAYHINALSNVQIPKGTYAKIKQLVSYCKTIAGDLSNAFVAGTNAGGVKKTMSNTADQLIQLRRMAYHINKLAGTDVNTSGFSAFIEQLKEALQSLKELNGELELDIEVKLSDKFEESVNKAIEKIKKGKEKIKKQKTSVSFTIPVSVTFSVSTNLGSALGAISSAVSTINSARSRAEQGGGGQPANPLVRKATGGYVYRAKGGGIGFPGKPRGTDTVPTWLTPGEYVHNKQAVNTFGMDFMRKVNNLDVRGAMSELMHKAGSMANINRGTTINNTTYNNQQVTINNNDPTGAGFTFKRASRFVGAF